jgi:hypothetical protein
MGKTWKRGAESKYSSILADLRRIDEMDFKSLSSQGFSFLSPGELNQEMFFLYDLTAGPMAFQAVLSRIFPEDKGKIGACNAPPANSSKRMTGWIVNAAG